MTEYNNVPLEVRNEIEKVLDRFNASRVHSLMFDLSWKWAGSESVTGVPEPHEIRATARYLLIGAYLQCVEGSSRGYLATGGLIGMCDLVDGYKPQFEIVFAAISAESYQ